MKSTNKFFIGLSGLALVLLLSGCQRQYQSGPSIDKNSPDSAAEYSESKADLANQPPVSSSTEISDIENEVDGTLILEEDFSDI